MSLANYEWDEVCFRLDRTFFVTTREIEYLPRKSKVLCCKENDVVLDDSITNGSLILK